MSEQIGIPDNQTGSAKKENSKETKKEIERLTFEDLKLRLKDLIRDNPKEINDKIVKFAKSLRNGYEDFNGCTLYHVLACRDYPEGNYTFFDFPGKDSVEEFIVGSEKERANREDKEMKASMGLEE